MIDVTKDLMEPTIRAVNTYHAGIGFIEQKSSLLSHISEILTAISQFTEPIPGMLVLILMHLSY